MTTTAVGGSASAPRRRARSTSRTARTPRAGASVGARSNKRRQSVAAVATPAAAAQPAGHHEPHHAHPHRARPPAGELAALEGARGLSALCVVVGHLLSFWTVKEAGAPLFGLEYLSSVTFFLIVSGFTLTRLYGGGDAASLAALAGGRTVGFLRRRLARLAPLYYLGLAAGLVPLAVYATSPWEVPAGVVLPALGLQSLTVVTGNELNGPLWTVSALLGGYAAFPTAVRVLRSLSTPRLTAAAAAMCIVPLALAHAWLTLVPLDGFFFVHAWAPVRVAHFLLGVATAVLAERLPARDASAAAWWRRPTLAVEVLSVLLAANLVTTAVATEAVRAAGEEGGVPYVYAGPSWPEAGLPGGSGSAGVDYYVRRSVYAEFGLAPLLAAWVAALAAAGANKGAGGGPTAAVLTSRPARALGRLSYALYCTHWPVLHALVWAAAVADGLPPTAVPGQRILSITAYHALTPRQLPGALAVCLAVAAAAAAVEPALRRAGGRVAAAVTAALPRSGASGRGKAA